MTFFTGRALEEGESSGGWIKNPLREEVMGAETRCCLAKGNARGATQNVRLQQAASVSLEDGTGQVHGVVFLSSLIVPESPGRGGSD